MQSSKTFLDKANHNSKVNRPEHLYFRKRFTCDENVNFTLNSSSSEDINSPVEDNYCDKNTSVDKPITLVSIFINGFWVLYSSFSLKVIMSIIGTSSAKLLKEILSFNFLVKILFMGKIVQRK